MIKEVADKDLTRAIDLVNDVFAEFIAVDYSEQGKSTFESYLNEKLDKVASSLKSEHKKMWAYYQEDEILGVIATQGISHISLMFVDKRHHGTGIARQMFNFVLEELAKNKNVTQITVNSSPYATKIYENLGFVKTSEQQEKDGIIYLPMAYPI
ncbi:MAG: GNAT family N-acetyltransferase [Oscillospiraceae bacterium]|nr:GNAT family N-acetyltransferase [Oscillospiraceae bacterium]